VISDSELSDGALCERSVAGDATAFASIMHRYKLPVFSFIRRYVGGNEDAHDLLQQVFIAAWQSLASYDVDRPLGRWLTAIALNKCRDHSRKAKVRRFFQLSWPIDAADIPDAAPTADQKMNADQDLVLLDRAIAQLPPALKEPLLLTVFEGLSHSEAGAELGISAKAVEGKTRRARQALELQINKWANNF
jgi:RNA polymerase sigma factor CnrH